MEATHLEGTHSLPSPKPYEMILEFARAQRAEDPYSFQFKAQEYRLRMSGGVTRSARFPWSEQLMEELRTLTRAQPAPEAAKRLGEHLRRFLDALDWGGHEHVLERSVRTPGPLRVVIRSAAAELYALPWELVTLKDSGQHLADLPGCTVSYEWPTERGDITRSPAPEKGRVLFAWSAAGGMVPAVQHLRTLEQSCQRAGLAFDEQRDVLPTVSLNSLEERLSTSPEPISVLHVLCHGAPLKTQESGAYGLMWNASSKNQEHELVDGARLAALLSPYASTLKLVVLCACHGGDGGKLASHLGSVAQELHRAGIGGVVASRLPLSLPGSVLMTETLYQKLLVEACSLEEALGAARRRLRVAGNGFDWAALQFYARGNQRLSLGQRNPQDVPRVRTGPQRPENAVPIWRASFLGLGANGWVGDPSEGGMISAAKLASTQGVAVVSDVTLTGIVNPDGSIGPVDGLLQRLQGAAKAGKRTFGYPAGQGHDWDVASGQLVDLHGPAQQQGVALQEVRDLYEAYELLTGQRLSRPQPVDTSAMNLSPTILQRMQARASALQARSESSLAHLKQPGPYTDMLEPLVAKGSQEATLAARYLAEGVVPAAHQRALQAVAVTDAALNLPRLLDPLVKLELDKLPNLGQELASVEADCHAFLARIATNEPLSVARTMTLLTAYTDAMLALAQLAVAKFHMIGCGELLQQAGATPLENLEQILQQLIVLLMRACGFLSFARLGLEEAADMLESPAEQEQQLKLEAPSLLQLARAYASAAQAHFDFYEARMTQVETQQAGQSQAPLPSDSFLLARALMELALSGLGQPEGILAGLFSLASAVAAYEHSAQFVTRQYSLRVEEDESGTAVAVRRDKAFMAMLEWAEIRARELAAEAREATGAVPVQAQLSYQLACAQREGTVEDKLNALGEFWNASLTSQIAVALATSSHGPRR